MLRHRELRLELEALKAFAGRTGADLRAMIDVTPEDRAKLEDFCRANPGDAGWVRYALMYREEMLAILDREAETSDVAA
jgi:hypothetical protein